MTAAQERVINHIKKELPRFDFYSKDGYEIKEFEVAPLSDESKILSVYIVTGMKNDEGTMAAILCRKYRHFFIGVRGGIETCYYNNKFLTTFRKVKPFELLNCGYRG